MLRTGTGRATRISIGPPVRSTVAVVAIVLLPMVRGATVAVVAVVAHAAPVPTAAVVSDAPAVRDPGVVRIPDRHQRRGRAPVVGPGAPIGVQKYERPMHVVVPTAGPVDAGEGVDGLGVGVHIGDDRDLFSARHLLVADHLGRVLVDGCGIRLLGDIDVPIGDVRGRDITIAVVPLVVGGRGRTGGRVAWRGRLLLGLGPVAAAAGGHRQQAEKHTQSQNRSSTSHTPSVWRGPLEYNPGDHWSP